MAHLSGRSCGKRVVFAETEGERESPAVITSTRRFSVPLIERGKSIMIVVDLSTWSRPHLTRSFAIALREDLLSPRTVCTRQLIGTRVRELARFWHFLETTRSPVQEIGEITTRICGHASTSGLSPACTACHYPRPLPPARSATSDASCIS